MAIQKWKQKNKTSHKKANSTTNTNKLHDKEKLDKYRKYSKKKLDEKILNIYHEGSEEEEEDEEEEEEDEEEEEEDEEEEEEDDDNDDDNDAEEVEDDDDDEEMEEEENEHAEKNEEFMEDLVATNDDPSSTSPSSSSLLDSKKLFPKLDTYNELSDSDADFGEFSEEEEEEEEEEERRGKERTKVNKDDRMNASMNLDSMGNTKPLFDIITQAYQSSTSSSSVSKKKKSRLNEEHTEAYQENEFHVPSHSQPQLSVTQLVSAFNDEAEFGLLKQQVDQLQKEKKETQRLRAPLPDRLQARIQRQTYYKETKKEMDQWQPLMNQIQHKQQIPKSLTSLSVPTPTLTSLASTQPILHSSSSISFSSLETKLAELTHPSTLSSTPTEDDASELLMDQDTSSPPASNPVPPNVVDPKKLKKKTYALRYLRELALRQEEKAKRAAKIKSKTYRRVMKREKVYQKKKHLHSSLASNPDTETALRMHAEYERAENRLTLKKKTTWADCAALLPTDPPPPTTPNDRIDTDHADTDPASMPEVPRHGVFGMAFMTRAIATAHPAAPVATPVFTHTHSVAGRRRVGGALPSTQTGGHGVGGAQTPESFAFTTAPPPATAFAAPADPWQVSGTSRAPSPLPRTLPMLSLDIPALGVGEEETGRGGGATTTFAEADVAALFEMDHVVDEFRERKEEAVRADAPSTVDATLPGWGSWSGAHLPPARATATRVLHRRAGIPRTRRADYGHAHVIMHPSLPRAVVPYVTAHLPHPFVHPDDYAYHLRPTLGKEWVTHHQVASRVPVRVVPGTVVGSLRSVRGQVTAKRGGKEGVVRRGSLKEGTTSKKTKKTKTVS